MLQFGSNNSTFSKIYSCQRVFKSILGTIKYFASTFYFFVEKKVYVRYYTHFWHLVDHWFLLTFRACPINCVWKNEICRCRLSTKISQKSKDLICKNYSNHRSYFRLFRGNDCQLRFFLDTVVCRQHQEMLSSRETPFCDNKSEAKNFIRFKYTIIGKFGRRSLWFYLKFGIVVTRKGAT